MANLTDADKVLRNDTGKDIVTQLTAIKTAIENGGGGGGGASTVSQLTDVLLSSTIPDGDVLVRDNNLTGGKLWKNKTITVELTQAEYNQLVADDEVLPDVDYYITDAPSMQGTSADLSYDGTTLSTHDKIEGLNASDLPITSGSATNTKSYIDTKQNKTWTLLGTLTGAQTLTLPNGWNEALIVGRFGGNAQYGFTSYIIALHGGTNPYRFINGCGQTSDNHQVIWTLGGDNKVGLQTWKYNGTDYTSTSSLLVYYR